MEHVARIKKQMGDLISHLKVDISRVEDAKAKVLFEVSAEAITGLVTLSFPKTTKQKILSSV